MTMPSEILTTLVTELKSQCCRHTNGICQTLNCLIRGGYKPGDKVNYEIATCERHEQVTALETLLATMREATPEEIKWCNRMKRLMKEKPKTITLFCNGNMHVLCSNAVNNIKPGDGMPQPIYGVSTLGPAEGGDF